MVMSHFHGRMINMIEIPNEWSYEEFLEHYPDSDLFEDELDFERAKFVSNFKRDIDHLGLQLT